MTDEFKRPENALTLKDQQFLKELGISGMSRGEEFVLKVFEGNEDARDRLEKRAEGLQSLDLDDPLLKKIAEDSPKTAEEIGSDLQFYRDLEKADEEDESL